MNLLLIGSNDLVRFNLEHVVDDAKEHGHVAQQFGGDALARGVDGHLAPRASKHERCRKHADTDGLPKPVFFNMQVMLCALSDEQAIDLVIQASCNYDNSLGLQSFLQQRKFFQSLNTCPRMREAARAYLNGEVQDMPRIVGMHVW